METTTTTTTETEPPELTTHERLARYRARAGLTQGQVASAIGVAQKTISRWEIDRLPSVEHGMLLAQIYGVPVSWLVQVPQLTESGDTLVRSGAIAQLVRAHP